MMDIQHLAYGACFEIRVSAELSQYFFAQWVRSAVENSAFGRLLHPIQHNEIKIGTSLIVSENARRGSGGEIIFHAQK